MDFLRAFCGIGPVYPALPAALGHKWEIPGIRGIVMPIFYLCSSGFRFFHREIQADGYRAGDQPELGVFHTHGVYGGSLSFFRKPYSKYCFKIFYRLDDCHLCGFGSLGGCRLSSGSENYSKIRGQSLFPDELRLQKNNSRFQ
ncbi:hypothetical protein ES703_32246 [subsurface metagenome]